MKRSVLALSVILGSWGSAHFTPSHAQVEKGAFQCDLCPILDHGHQQYGSPLCHRVNHESIGPIQDAQPTDETLEAQPVSDEIESFDVFGDVGDTTATADVPLSPSPNEDVYSYEDGYGEDILLP